MNWVNKTTAAMMLVLLAGIVVQSAEARFLGFGSDSDDAFIHIGGDERGTGVGPVGVGGDEGLVHVGDSEEYTYDRSVRDEYHSNQDFYQQGRDDQATAEMRDQYAPAYNQPMYQTKPYYANQPRTPYRSGYYR